MATAVYRVVPQGDEWGVEHDGKVAGHYATKELAFEAADGAATLSLGEGLGIEITAPEGAGGRWA